MANSKNTSSCAKATAIFVDLELIHLHLMGTPLARSLGSGLWEVRSSFPGGIARVIFTMKDNQIVLLHELIKKSQKTPIDELELAKKRFKNLG